MTNHTNSPENPIAVEKASDTKMEEAKVNSASKTFDVNEIAKNIYWCVIIYFGVVIHAAIYLSDYDTKTIIPFTYFLSVSAAFLAISFFVMVVYGKKFNSDKFKMFLDLPDSNAKLTYPVLSTFVSEQAFCSLLATILVAFSKPTYIYAVNEWHWTYVGTFLLSLINFLIICCIALFSVGSLVRFLFHCQSFTNKAYIVMLLISIIFTCGLIYLGFRLGM